MSSNHFVVKMTRKELRRSPQTLKRLQFLTNGGWGRRDSRMYDVLSWGLDEDEDASHFWLVVHNGIIQGWACLSPDCDRKGKLIWPLDVYVGVKYRRQGVGRDLLHRALTYAKRNKLSVVVNPWNHTSKKFYLPIKDQVTWDRRCLQHLEGKWK